MRKSMIFIILLAGILTPLQAQQSNIAFLEKDKVPQTPNLPWPVDKNKGLNNFAQEIIFDKERLNNYLELAKGYYIAGINGMLTYLGEEEFKIYRKVAGIKIYEPDPNKGDPYERNPYKIEIFTTTGISVLKDFIESEWCFTEALNILKYIGNWDKTITTKELYIELADNIYRSLIYCSVYINNYPAAMTYIQEYKKISKDEKWLLEWETRVLGVLVGIAKKYDWCFTGDKSLRSLKLKHRELLLQAIEYYYPDDSDLKKVLKKQIYPEFVYEPPASATNNNSAEKK